MNSNSGENLRQRQNVPRERKSCFEHPRNRHDSSIWRDWHFSASLTGKWLEGTFSRAVDHRSGLCRQTPVAPELLFRSTRINHVSILQAGTELQIVARKPRATEKPVEIRNQLRNSALAESNRRAQTSRASIRYYEGPSWPRERRRGMLQQALSESWSLVSSWVSESPIKHVE